MKIGLLKNKLVDRAECVDVLGSHQSFVNF
jgi:hypothetical protein